MLLGLLVPSLWGCDVFSSPHGRVVGVSLAAAPDQLFIKGDD